MHSQIIIALFSWEGSNTGGFHTGGSKLKRTEITKKSLENKDVKGCKNPSKGFYIGFKLKMALDYRTLFRLSYSVSSVLPSTQGCRYDSKLFTPIMDELQRRRIIRKGDTVAFDKYKSLQHHKNLEPKLFCEIDFSAKIFRYILISHQYIKIFRL